MQPQKFLLGIIILFVVGSQSLAQEAMIVIPTAVTNKPYHCSIDEMLRKEYGRTKPLVDWEFVGPAPVGFDIERETGRVFGTSVAVGTYLFHVQAWDRSVKQPVPTKFLISLQITSSAESLEQTTRQPKSTPSVSPQPGNAVVTGAGDDVEIPSIVPRKDFKLPIKIKNDSIRRLEVVAQNKTTNKTVTALTPPELARGEVVTTVDLALEEGDYTITISDPATKKLYRTINMTVGASVVTAPTDGEFEIRHSGFVPRKDKETHVAVVAGPKISKFSIVAFEKAADGQLTKPLKEIKVPLLTRDKNDYLILVPLAESGGVTKVTVKDLTPGSKLERSIEIKTETAGGTQTAGDGGGSGNKKITVEKPDDKVDRPSVDAYVTVKKESGIKKVRYWVTNDDKSYTGEFVVNPTALKDEETPVPIRLLKGTNFVRFFDANAEAKAEAEIEIVCSTNCASSYTTAEFAGSQYTRAIVGVEQAGASSASSKTKPFVDFFFNAPLLFTGDCGTKPNGKLPFTSTEQEELKTYNDCRSKRLPRLGVWGNVRFATTPDQIAAIGVLPSNFANTLGNPSNTVDLVQSFDFLVGLEARLFTVNGHFVSLIPGLPQKTHFFVAGGGGATNPLNAQRELAQIFKIPAPNSPQRDDFIARYGTPPSNEPPKEFVGLVPLDRDRFLRQWYAGLRLKTLYCKNSDCEEYENSFPAIVDVMFGQNEAVTGGDLFYVKTDPDDPTRTLKKRSFVLRFDAFYPFPLQKANFLYFYGTAIMKIGAGGVRIQNPLFLDIAPGDVLITDPRVYIPPVDLQKMFQPSRDYYKIGVGVDLINLINRATGKG